MKKERTETIRRIRLKARLARLLMQDDPAPQVPDVMTTVRLREAVS